MLRKRCEVPRLGTGCRGNPRITSTVNLATRLRGPSPRMTAAGKCHVIINRDQSAGGSQRQLRVGELIRHEIADMLTRGDIHDPVIETHHDHGARSAHERRICGSPRSTSCRSAAATRRQCSRRLERNKRYVRGEIARRVNLKFAPEIRFRIDERFDEAERIEKLLRTPVVQRDLERPRKTIDVRK